MKLISILVNLVALTLLAAAALLFVAAFGGMALVVWAITAWLSS